MYFNATRLQSIKSLGKKFLKFKKIILPVHKFSIRLPFDANKASQRIERVMRSGVTDCVCALWERERKGGAELQTVRSWTKFTQPSYLSEQAVFSASPLRFPTLILGLSLCDTPLFHPSGSNGLMSTPQHKSCVQRYKLCSIHLV